MGLLIGFVYDLRSDYIAKGLRPEDVAEFDSESTIDSINTTLESLGHTVERIGNAQSLCRHLVRGRRWDLVFNIAEGLHGVSREARVPAILEAYSIPFTFSDPLTCAAALDKATAKRIMIHCGIPTPPFHTVETASDIASVALKFPLFVKPVAEGTGKGIDTRSIVDNRSDLRKACSRLVRRYGQAVLVEEYLPGREFTTGILGTGRHARVLGSLEIVIPDPSFRGVYSLETKERCEDLVRYMRVKEGALKRAVESVALKAHIALGCRDASRVDVKLDRHGKPAVMEINPIPGMHPTHSDLPMIATNAGMPYRQLLRDIVASAAARIQPGTDRPDRRRTESR